MRFQVLDDFSPNLRNIDGREGLLHLVDSLDFLDLADPDLEPALPQIHALLVPVTVLLLVLPELLAAVVPELPNQMDLLVALTAVPHTIAEPAHLGCLALLAAAAQHLGWDPLG